jgi:YgiT-type zinc finger domain-containing protein
METRDSDIRPLQICPECGAAAVRTEICDHQFQYGDGANAVELTARIPVRTCGSCGFQFIDAEGEEAKDAAAYRYKQVMSPAQLEALRELHGLSLGELARISRIGIASLRRWESGRKIQNGAYDDYLYLLGWGENLDRLRHRRALRISSPNPKKPFVFRAVDAATRRTDARQFKLTLTPINTED